MIYGRNWLIFDVIKGLMMSNWELKKQSENKVPAYGGWYMVLGMALHIFFMGILVAFNFKNVAAMVFLMKLNVWIGSIAVGIGLLWMKIQQVYIDLNHLDSDFFSPDKDGYMVDRKIKGIRVIYIERLDNFFVGVIVGVMFWVLPFMGMAAK